MLLQKMSLSLMLVAMMVGGDDVTRRLTINEPMVACEIYSGCDYDGNLVWLFVRSEFVIAGSDEQDRQPGLQSPTRFHVFVGRDVDGELVYFSEAVCSSHTKAKQARQRFTKRGKSAFIEQWKYDDFGRLKSRTTMW